MSMQSLLLSNVRRFLLRRSGAWQRESAVRDPGLWGLEVNDAGHLSVEGVDTLDLVAEYGSPLLVVSRSRLLQDTQELKVAFDRAPTGSKILYSYKTNCIPGILAPLHGLGIGAEVISPYELWLADQLGVSGGEIVYNGVAKSDESIERAIRMGVLAINIDHLEEIDRIAAIASRLRIPANVGVRLALSASSQFGLDLASGEALAACRNIAALGEHLRFKCIHVHLTSNAKDAGAHKAYAITALKFARAMSDATGVSLAYLDLGGGFGVPTSKNMSGYEYGLYRLFGVLPRPPEPEHAQPVRAFMADLVETVAKTCATLRISVPRLLIEPGRLVTSRAEFLLARVNAVKRRAGGPHFALTDAGRLSVTFPCDFEYHEAFIAGRPLAPLTKFYEVKGRVCTSADWMFKNRMLPELSSGDILAVMDGGAYFSSYSSNFAFPRPAILMIDQGDVRVIRKEETFEHLTAMDARAAFEEPSAPRTHIGFAASR